MSYIRQKIISGHPYLYEQSNKREGRKVRTHHERYIGKLTSSSSNKDNLGTTYKQELTPERKVDIELITSAKREIYADKDRKLAIKASERLFEKGLDTKNLYTNQNTKQYTEERQIIHKIIEDEFLTNSETIALESKKPTVILLGGAPGSGKSSAILNLLDKKKYVVLDNDEIKQKLPEYRGYNASLLHRESSDIYDAIILKAMPSRKNMILDATLRNTSKAKDMINLFKQAGYEIKLYGTQLSKEHTVTRVTHRAIHRGRYVPPEYVIRNTDKINKSVRDLTPYVDEYRIYDTTEFGNPTIVMEGKNV